MCLIIDPPVLIPIFKKDDAEHPEYAEVAKWITSGKGKIIIGGSQYSEELKKIPTVLVFIAELSKKNKVIRKDSTAVDNEVRKVKRIEPSNDFDDPHLVALARLTECKIICLRDKRAHKFVTNKIFYKSKKPKIYSGSKNKSLISDKNISKCCM